jgi:hypothetical protein
VLAAAFLLAGFTAPLTVDAGPDQAVHPDHDR